jgi:protein SCO1/2
LNKKALYGILIALVIPLICFFIINSLPKAAIPKPYLIDSVNTKVVNGKQVNDTSWHRVSDFELTNQLGRKVSWKNISTVNGTDTARKIVVANFFFTHCPKICPAMTMNMKKLQDGIKSAVEAGDTISDFVQFISFSIDPERDSVPELKKWSDRFQINPSNWWLLTGDKQAIYNLSYNDMKLAMLDPKIDSIFPHSDCFVLIDKHGVMRARRDKYGNPQLYHGMDSASVANLAEDIVLLSLEKEHGQSFLRGHLTTIAVSLLIAFLVGGIFLFVIRKNRS